MVGGLEGIPLPAALVTALREGSGSGAHGLVGILLFVLSSVPLGQLSRKAASVLVVLLSAVLAAVKRLRERRTLSSESGHEQMVFNDAFGTRHEVLFLGDAGVGKTSLIAALRDHVPPTLNEITAEGSSSSSLSSCEDLPWAASGSAKSRSDNVRRHAVIVWTANLADTMRAYASRWRGTATSTGGSAVPMLIVCNMTDIAPCPLPEMNAMRGTKIPALAVSAARGTNVGALWLLIERGIAAVHPVSSASGSPRLEKASPVSRRLDEVGTLPPVLATGMRLRGASIATTSAPSDKSMLRAPRPTGSTPSPASVIPSVACDTPGSLVRVSSHELVDGHEGAWRPELSEEASKESFEHSYEAFPQGGVAAAATAA